MSVELDVDVAVKVDVAVEVVEVLLVVVVDVLNVVLVVVTCVDVVLTRAVDVVGETKVEVVVMEVVDETLAIKLTVKVEKAVPKLVITTVLGKAVLTVLAIVEVKEHDGIIPERNW